MGDQGRLLAWIDLETTGLSAKDDVILEIALIITDCQGRVLTRYSSVIDWGDNVEANVLSRMRPYVVDMHTKSGLICALKQRQGNSLDVVERNIYEKLQSVGVTKDRDHQAVLAGSSVHFDRSFIKEHMLYLDKLLHYRILDVSSFKVAFPRLFPKREVMHRAEDDIQASLNMLYIMQDRVNDSSSK